MLDHVVAVTISRRGWTVLPLDDATELIIFVAGGLEAAPSEAVVR